MSTRGILALCSEPCAVAMRIIAGSIAAFGLSACDGLQLKYACGHEPHFDCSPFVAARARLARVPTSAVDPYDAETYPYDAVEGTCGALRYLQYHVDTVPGDEQEDEIITQYYDRGGALVAARVADNLDSSGTFASHIDYGAVPSCTLTMTATVNPAKERFRQPSR